MKPSSDLKLVIFDCDGTLVDSQASIVSSMSSCFTAADLPAPTPEQVRRVVGLPLIVAMQVLAPDHPALHADLVEGYRSAFSELRRRGMVDEEMFPGLIACLDALEAEGYLLGVATGKAMKGLVNTLATHELQSRFTTLQTADIAAGKPSPDMVLRALSETGAEKGATAVIGDTTYDIEMARNAGVCSVGVSWGYHPTEELRAAGADVIVESFGEIPGVLGRLM